MSSLWINILPDTLLRLLPALSLFIVGYLVEKQFVGRTSTFCNTLAINLFVISLSNPSDLLVWYSNIGLIMGVVGIAAYAIGNSLPQIYYWLSWAYCSIVVAAIILLVH